MNKTLITATVILSVVLIAGTIDAPEQTITINQDITIVDDGVSPVEILPVEIVADFLPEGRYTYNDLLSEEQILKRRGDENYLKVQALRLKLGEELFKLPERTMPTIDEVIQ